MKLLKVIFITLLILIAAAAIYFVVSYKVQDKEKQPLTDADRKGTTGQYIKLSQGVTHYQLSGPDTGKVVVLVHGFSVPYFIWDGTYEFLAKQGFRVLRYDQYGRGYSDRPDVTYNQALYHTQLTDLISALHLKMPVDLMGVSFGGGIITSFAGQHPDMVNKVILIDPVYPFPKPGEPEIYTDYHEATHGDDRATSQLADFKYPKLHPDWIAKYTPQMGFKGFRHALVSSRYNFNYDGKAANTLLNRQNKPVLLIWGKEDNTVPFNYSDSVRSVLKVDFFPVDDAGHLPYIEQPDKVNAKILEFLRK